MMEDKPEYQYLITGITPAVSRVLPTEELLEEGYEAESSSSSTTSTTRKLSLVNPSSLVNFDHYTYHDPSIRCIKKTG